MCGAYVHLKKKKPPNKVKQENKNTEYLLLYKPLLQVFCFLLSTAPGTAAQASTIPFYFCSRHLTALLAVFVGLLILDSFVGCCVKSTRTGACTFSSNCNKHTTMRLCVFSAVTITQIQGREPECSERNNFFLQSHRIRAKEGEGNKGQVLVQSLTSTERCRLSKTPRTSGTDVMYCDVT